MADTHIPQLLYPLSVNEHLSCLCKCCSEYGCADIFLNWCFCFLQINTQRLLDDTVLLYTILYGICTNLHSHQQCTRITFSLHLYQHLLFLVFLILVILPGVRWYFIVVSFPFPVLVSQLCPLCDPMDCSLLGSSVHGILQLRILEWVAIPFSKGSSQPRDQTQVSCIAGRFFTVWATREDDCLCEAAPFYLPVGCLYIGGGVSVQILCLFF